MCFVKRFFSILLLVVPLLLGGCDKSPVNNSNEVEPPVNIPDKVVTEPGIYEQLKRYVIYNFEWIDNENVIIQACHEESNRDKIPLEQPYVKTFLYNVYTNDHELLYAGGTDISRGMEDIVSVKDKVYVYDETECQVFNGYNFEYLYDFRSEAEREFGRSFSVNISKDGLCTARTANGDIIVFPINEIENYKVVKLATDEKIQSKHNNEEKASATWYTKPRWSADGNNVIFMEIDVRTEKVAIWMVSKDGKIEKSFDFSAASNYAILDDDKYLLAICEPFYSRDKKEIRIYSVNDLSYK